MAIRKPFFVVPLDLGTVVTGNAQPGYSVRHLGRHKAAALTWKTDGASNVWARGNLAGTRTIDFCSVMLANALPDTQIRLRLGTTQAEVDGNSAPYDSGAVDFIDPAITREDGLYHSHLELDDPEAGVLWWRIDITGHTGDFQASMLVLGEKIEPSHFFNFDDEEGVEDLGGALEFNRWGVASDEGGAVFRTKDFTLAWQTQAEYQASFRPMVEKLGSRGIVYLCFAPEATTHRQADTYLGIFRKAVIAKGVRHPGYRVQEFQVLSML